jgi:hypothetical protein
MRAPLEMLLTMIVEPFTRGFAHRSEDLQKGAGTMTRARPRCMIAAGTIRSRRRAFLRRIDQKAATEKRSWRRTIFLGQIGLGKGLDAEIAGRQGQPSFPGAKGFGHTFGTAIHA